MSKLQESINSLNVAYDGFAMNVSKTKVMHLRKPKQQIVYIGTVFSENGKLVGGTSKKWGRM